MEVSGVERDGGGGAGKAGVVADSVKGMKVTEALAYLEFSPKHAARDVAKAIKSAAANAEHNFNLNREDLMVKQLLIDEGPTYRRRPPGSRSMAHEFFHRTCHITAVFEDRPKVKKQRGHKVHMNARRLVVFITLLANSISYPNHYMLMWSK